MRHFVIQSGPVMSLTPEVYKQAEDKRRIARESAEQNSLFREVEDDLRHERMTRLWKRYGFWVIGAAVAVVLVVAGYQIQKSMRESERVEQAAIMDQAEAALMARDADKATALLTQLEKSGNSGYRTLARLRHATLLLSQDKKPEARELLAQVASDADTLPAYRDLAVVQDALVGLDSDDPKTIEDKLAPLTVAGHPWRHTAIEISALAMAKAGEPGRAAQALQGILDDPDTSPERRAMAESLRSVFARDAAAK